MTKIINKTIPLDHRIDCLRQWIETKTGRELNELEQHIRETQAERDAVLKNRMLCEQNLINIQKDIEAWIQHLEADNYDRLITPLGNRKPTAKLLEEQIRGILVKYSDLYSGIHNYTDFINFMVQDIIRAADIEIENEIADSTQIDQHLTDLAAGRDFSGETIHIYRGRPPKGASA